MDNRTLIMLQSLPLDIKIAKTKLRIREYIDHFGEDNVYVSFSGGKDSTVLLHLVRTEYPNVKAVFVDTGLEYPEVKAFVRKQENVEIIRPKMSFKQVIENYGYPMISKEQSQFLHELRLTKSDKLRDIRLNGNKWGRGKVSEKWKFMINAPFKVSHKCCDVMKKTPSKLYEKKTGRVPIVGTMACESALRTQLYLRNGCNSFDTTRVKSTPIGFWTEQDVFAYIELFGLEIASCYGDIVKEGENYRTTKCERTGCVFCGFGIHLEKGTNRYQKLEKTHPQLHAYCMDKLGFADVCDYMGVKYKGEQDGE